ncbi:MAG: ROK family protein, partial [Clostridia bacterium]
MPQSANQQVKQHNRNRIRELMRQKGSATKQQLSTLSGLSVVTLGTLMAELLETGEVLEGAAVSADFGRPATVYHFAADHAHVLACCFLQHKGADVLALSVADLQGKVLCQAECALKADVPKQLLAITKSYLQKDPSISAVGIGIPGQAVNGKVLFCDIGSLAGVSLQKLLEEQTHLPIVIENDMNATVYGYACRVQPKEDECTVGVYFPLNQGPGAGILLGRRLLRGQNGMSGELGQLPMPVDWAKPPEPFEAIISDFLQAINAILAPERMIVYREEINTECLEACIQRSWPSIAVRPTIVTHAELAPDYALGMRMLTLKQLWPKT